MSKIIAELEIKLLDETIKEVAERAYKQGIEDARNEQSLPHMLKKQDIANYFQVALGTVEHIIRMEGFPHSKVARARYPRDKFIEWANKNMEYINYHKQ